MGSPTGGGGVGLAGQIFFLIPFSPPGPLTWEIPTVAIPASAALLKFPGQCAIRNLNAKHHTIVFN